jgi:hypothetical protein
MTGFKTTEKTRAAARAWSAANPERKKATRRAYYAANKEAIKTKARQWELANPEKKRARNRVVRLRKEYGITPAQFDAMLAFQRGRCDICRRSFRSSRHIHVDHNHETGKVRSLLCATCNTALGHLEKRGWLSRASLYLAKHAAGMSNWTEADEDDESEAT